MFLTASHVLALLIVAAPILSATAHSPFPFTDVQSRTPIRRLEAENAYVDDLTSYSMSFGKCLRIKVRSDADDDGNQYFYNGKYYAQQQRYVSYYLCDNSGNSCDCDLDTEYVTDIETYTQTYAAYLGYGNDDDGGGDDGNNASYLTYCKQAYADEETGAQYYAGPTCDGDGSMVIGLFYDEDCTVKSGASYDADYAGTNFKSYEDMQPSCLDCADSDDNGNLCSGYYQGAYHCSSGANVNGNVAESDYVNVCKTYLAAAKAPTYYNNSTKKNVWRGIFGALIIAAGVLAGFLVFSGYVYFVRHRNDNKKPLLDTQEGGVIA